MLCAKGRTLPDGSYIYTCGKCHGNGRYYGRVCDWCYGLDLDDCRAQIKTARGQRYYSLLKAILSLIGRQMVEDVRQYAGFSPVDIAYIALKYDLNFKATCEWLEETQVIRSGVYRHIGDSRIKIGELYDKARDKWAAELGATE